MGGASPSRRVLRWRKVEHREEGLAPLDLLLLRAVPQSPAVADYDRDLLGARDARVEEVAVVHEGVRLVHHDHRARELAALRLVDRQRVRELEVPGEAGVRPDLHLALLEPHPELAALRADLR